MVVVAIASLKLGNGFLGRDYLNALRFSFTTLVDKAHYESPQPQAAAVKPPQVEAPRPTTSETAKAPASVPLTERRSSASRDEGTRGSSSAAAIRAPRPKLPAKIESKITSDNTVEVRVRIDESGRVVGATALSTNGPVATSLVRYALATARRWRFRAARQNGKPVQSESILEFLFRPSDSLVSRVDGSSELRAH